MARDPSERLATMADLDNDLAVSTCSIPRESLAPRPVDPREDLAGPRAVALQKRSPGRRARPTVVLNGLVGVIALLASRRVHGIQLTEQRPPRRDGARWHRVDGS
jgi:hypothetical protein